MTKKVEDRFIALDFEFNGISEELVNLVSCVTHDLKTKKTQKFWLHNSPNEQKRLTKYLMDSEKPSIILGYQCVAEARSFLSLNLDPLYFRWIDLFLEYRMLTNHNDRLQWGKQLVDGKVRSFTKPPPKWDRTEEDGAGFKATHSLAEATYKLTGEIRDTIEKDQTRDLIISSPPKFSTDQREQILKYNAADVEFLPKLWARVKEEFIEFVGGKEHADMQEYFQEALLRGRYSAHTAIMESIGYPINEEATRNFSRQIPAIMAEIQRDVNEQFPPTTKLIKAAETAKAMKSKVKVPQRPFRWEKAKKSFVWDQAYARLWLNENVDVARWMRTKKSKRFPNGQLSLALEAWERHFQYKHDYPRNNFGAQMVRFLKLKQSLYGFSEGGGGRKTFWDNVGKDGRARPYMNIFGAQSGRSQPGATGFIFLKPAWMRALVQPKKGMFVAGVDYGQEEFFLSGLESEDSNMIAAYLSGDPYMFGAKLAGAIPQDGVRADYKIERDLFKNTYLGILFGMTKYGLSIKLTNDLGRTYTEDDAQEQIDTFEETFPEYMDWKKDLLDTYREGNGILLPCGWRMGPDNDNPRSALNVPIQGMGASIMRKAVDMAVARGCRVIKTLHDAIYIEGKVGEEYKIGILIECMREAFQFYYRDTPKFFELAGNIKLDPFAWSPNYKKDSEIVVKTKKDSYEIPVSNLYIDERAGADYERFSKYFDAPDTDLL